MSIILYIKKTHFQEQRHDSGSDSGTEILDDHLKESFDDDEDEHNRLIIQDVFDLLEKTFSILICKQQDERDRDRLVLQFYRLLERKCLRKEAFSPHHKLCFQMWMKRMDQVWDISRSAAGNEVVMDKRKFDRK